MKNSALAALIGTLSIGALATGCATTKPATATMEKGAEGSCGAKEGEASCSAKATEEKGAEGSCGAGSCSAK